MSDESFDRAMFDEAYADLERDRAQSMHVPVPSSGKQLSNRKALRARMFLPMLEQRAHDEAIMRANVINPSAAVQAERVMEALASGPPVQRSRSRSRSPVRKSKSRSRSRSPVRKSKSRSRSRSPVRKSKSRSRAQSGTDKVRKTMRASPRWLEEMGSRNVPWGVYAEDDEFGSPTSVMDEEAWVYRRELNPVAGPCPVGTHSAPGYKRFDSNDYCVRDCQFWDPPRYMTRRINDGRCTGKRPDGNAGGRRRRVAREGGARRALTAYNVYTQRVNAGVKNIKPIEIVRSAAFREGWNNIKLIAFNARETAFEAMDREAGQGVVRNVIRSLGGGRSAHRSPYIDIMN